MNSETAFQKELDKIQAGFELLRLREETLRDELKNDALGDRREEILNELNEIRWRRYFLVKDRDLLWLKRQIFLNQKRNKK